MIFSYISGKGTDSSERGFYKWAQIKGKTENDLMKLPFKKVYNFRPGYLHPTPGLRNTLSYYKYFEFFYPFMKFFAPKSATTLGELGKAMIASALNNYEKNIIETEDILTLNNLIV